MGFRGDRGTIAALATTALLAASPAATAHAGPLPGPGSFTLLADAEPTLSVADAQIAEGNTGITTGTVTVSLSAASLQTVTVGYATAGDTATMSSDFGPASGTLTFDPGQTSKQLSLDAWGDIFDEVDETFFVRLTNPTGATLADAEAVVTIPDDDPVPTVTISDAADVIEGTGGEPTFQTNSQFIVRFSSPTSKPVTIDCDVRLGTASVGDIGAPEPPCPLSFPRGAGGDHYLYVPVVRDALTEEDETFGVLLFDAVNVTIGTDDFGVAAILDDDDPPPPPPPPPPGPPTLSIADTSVAEGTKDAPFTEWNNALFTVTLSRTRQTDTTVSFRAASGPPATGAVLGTDFIDPRSTEDRKVTIPAGQLTAIIGMPVAPDSVHEPDETFTVALGNGVASGAITRAVATAKIIDDDPAPAPQLPPTPLKLALDTSAMPAKLKLRNVCPVDKRGRPRTGAFEGTYELAAAAIRTTAKLSAELPVAKGKPKRKLPLALLVTKRVNPFSEDLRIPIERKRCAQLRRGLSRGGKATLVLSLGLTPVNAGVAAESRTLRIPLRR